MNFIKKIIKMNFIDKMFTRILVTAFGKKICEINTLNQNILIQFMLRLFLKLTNLETVCNVQRMCNQNL